MILGKKKGSKKDPSPSPLTPPSMESDDLDPSTVIFNQPLPIAARRSDHVWGAVPSPIRLAVDWLNKKGTCTKKLFRAGLQLSTAPFVLPSLQSHSFHPLFPFSTHTNTHLPSGLNEEGIYRVPGKATTFATYKALFDRGTSLPSLSHGPSFHISHSHYCILPQHTFSHSQIHIEGHIVPPCATRPKYSASHLKTTSPRAFNVTQSPNSSPLVSRYL